MGSNNLTSATNGGTITTEIVDQYKTALNEDIVPRNSSGIPTDEAGSNGTSVYRWLKGWFTSIGIGSSASNNTIEEDSGDMIVKINGTEKFRIGETSGVSGGLAGDGLTETSDGSLDVNPDNSTIELNGGDLRVKDSGVTLAKMNSLSVDASKIVKKTKTTSATSNSNQFAMYTGSISGSLGTKSITLTLKGNEGIVVYGVTGITSESGGGSLLLDPSSTAKESCVVGSNWTAGLGTASKSVTVATGLTSGSTITFTLTNSASISHTVRFWAYELF